MLLFVVLSSITILVLLFVAGDKKSLKTILGQQILVTNGLVFLHVCNLF